MDFSYILYDTCNCSEQMKADAYNAVQAKLYCAKSEIYCRYLQQNRERADLYRSQFREQNDKIFSIACEMLDLAIDNANVELANAALNTVNVMKSTYPDFYKSYYSQLLGKNGGII